MKRVIIPILFLLASCSKGSLEPLPMPIAPTISFATEVTPIKGVDKERFAPGDQIFVYGVNTDEDDFNPEAPNGSNYVFASEPLGGIRVVNYGKNESGVDVWQYGNPVVWLPGKSTFLAFSPVPYDGESYGITQPPGHFNLNDLPAIEFTVAGGYDPITATPEEIVASRALNKKQVDLMAAYAPNQTSGILTTLTFEHTLSRITFAVRPMQETGYMRINSVTLRNVLTSAKLRLVGVWEPNTLSRPRDFSLTLKNDVVNMIPATPDKTYPINEGDETLMMIPQSLNDVRMEIRYSYSHDGVNWPDYQDGKLISIELSKIAPAWKPANSYNYILTILPEGTNAFSPDIEQMETLVDVTIP